MDRARTLTGRTVAELASGFAGRVPESQRRAKGWTGELVERYLGANAFSLPEPDFRHLGIELKTLPVNNRGRPAESTFVCSVPLYYTGAVCWEDSTVRKKLNRVLWVPVESDASLPLAERRFGAPFLWSPEPAQEADLRLDWLEHMDLISTGELHRISASRGKYLQIRPKAADGRALTTTTVETGDTASTLPRGFYLRAAFTRMLLDNSNPG